MPDLYRVENFIHGLVNFIEEKSAPPGSAASVLNWLAKGDRIELRRGYKIVGADAGISPSKVTGLFTGHTIAGVEVLFRKRGRKLEYYDSTTSLFREIGTNLFPAAAVSDDMFFDEIFTQAGAQVWCGSPNSGLYKIMVNSGKSGSGFVEPGAKDNFLDATNHKGYIKVKGNRILLWRKLGDLGSIQGSHIDERNYTTVSNEVLGTGDGSEKTFSGTLAAITGRRTALAIVGEDTVETFVDNRDGTLTGDAGGTGTIDYSSGAISLTFNTAPAGAQDVLIDYQWEDSTDNGIADFTETATRVAGEGFYQPQGSGGAVQSIETYKDIEYCLHELNTWFLDITNDDTNANNQIYRDKVGIPTPRASVATGQGIYLVDDRGEGDVFIRLLTLDRSVGSTEVLPISISDNLDLSDFVFTDSIAFSFGDFRLIGCATTGSVDSNDNPVNNRTLVYDRVWKTWTVLDYYIRFAAVLGGALVVGDSLSGNVLELFSGFDDDDALIDNHYNTNLDEMEIRELKKSKTIRVEGDIQPDQDIDVLLGIDNDEYILLGTIIGDGEYVDVGQAVTVGATTIGKRPVGGGSAANQVVAYHYLRELRVRNLVDKFQRATVRFVAKKIGYASISSYEFYDITRHGSRIPGKYINQ